MDRLAETTLLPLHLWVLELLQLWNISYINSGLWAYKDHFFTLSSETVHSRLQGLSTAYFSLFSFSQELWWKSPWEAMTEYEFIIETRVLTSMNIFRQLWVLEALEICFNNFPTFWNLFKGPFLLFSIITAFGKVRFSQYSLWLCWKIDILIRNNLGISYIFPYSKSTEK